MYSKFSKNQNSLDWKISYTIRKILRFRCLKWACMIHLNIYNINYSRKKGRESKCQFDSRPLKVKNHPKLHAWRWSVTYCWNFFNEGYKFALNFTSIRGLHNKLWASKIARVLILKILKFPICKSREKWHLGVAPMVNHKK